MAQRAHLQAPGERAVSDILASSHGPVCNALIGKVIGLRRYFHVDAIPSIDPAHQELIRRAREICDVRDDAFNIVRVNTYSEQVSFLHYPRFFEDPFPVLQETVSVDLKRSFHSRRSYEDSLNPPILHRKELLLPSEHPSRALFQALTDGLESLGIYQTKASIGFLRQWEDVLARAGYGVEGHTLVPIGNHIPLESEEKRLQSERPHDPTRSIPRHLTALSRERLSAPLRLLERCGFLDGAYSVFDYGCGRGDDLKNLRTMGVRSSGWDPHYCPADPLVPSDFVNLGFVINVIEDLSERQYALTKAYSLARIGLVVATMLVSDQRAQGRPYRDGFISSIGTFQKYYSQYELQAFIDSALDESPIPLGPGVFVIFKDKEAEASFFSSRIRSASRERLRFNFGGGEGPAKSKKNDVARLSPLQQTLLDALWSQMLELGRVPADTEIVDAGELIAEFGSLKSAFKAVSQNFDLTRLEEAASQRRNEIIVMLSIRHFRRNGNADFSDAKLRNDILGLFGSFKAARQKAKELVISLREEQTLKDAILLSLDRGVGAHIEKKGFILHRSLVTRVPPQLRVAIWAASLLSDGLEACDLIRLHESAERISFYRHDDFEINPLPILRYQCKVDLKRQKVFDRYYSQNDDMRLVGKSRFISEEAPEFVQIQYFDSELSAVLEQPSAQLHTEMIVIASRLEEALREIDGYKLIRSSRIPNSDEKCGRFLTYGDLIRCGETQALLQIENCPQCYKSYAALHDLAVNILDPVIEYYGSIRLTYGFCSNELRKHIQSGVAPELDQHAAYEVNSRGKLVCSRLGAAVDFLIEDEKMDDVMKWIHDNLEFDRMYYYGPDRPLHVSFSETPAREVTELQISKGGKRIPRTLVL